MTKRKQRRIKSKGGAITISHDRAKQLENDAKAKQEMIDKNQSNPLYAGLVKEWQDKIKGYQTELAQYQEEQKIWKNQVHTVKNGVNIDREKNAEELARERAIKSAEERRELMLKQEQDNKWRPPGFREGIDLNYSGWLKEEDYDKRLLQELKKIPEATDNIIQQIVSLSNQTPYKYATAANPQPKPQQILGVLEDINSNRYDGWVTGKQKLKLAVQAVNDPVYTHERLNQIFNAINVWRSDNGGILNEQTPERIKEAIGQEIDGDAGAIIRLREKVYHEKYDLKGAAKGFADFADAIRQAADYISPIVSFLPGIGPAVSAAIDAASFGYDFAKASDDAEAGNVDSRYIEEQNTSFSKNYEEKEDEDYHFGNNASLQANNNNNNDTEEYGYGIRVKRKRLTHPILSGTKRMKWIKNTIPIDKQKPIT